MASDLRGASAESLEALVAVLGDAVSGGADGLRIGEDLFAVARLLTTQPGLRRVLTDVSRSGASKSALVEQVLLGKVDTVALALVADAARRRWASTSDLGYALEHLGVAAVVKGAERDGEADRLEDELFAFERLVSDNPGLRDALSDPARTAADKQELLRGLLADKVTAGGMLLAQQATDGSHRTVNVALEQYEKIVAGERERLVALVRVALPLEESESERLAGALSRQYQRPVHLNVVVDPEVIGGIRVEVGDDVIDGTVASRLDDARRRLAG